MDVALGCYMWSHYGRTGAFVWCWVIVYPGLIVITNFIKSFLVVPFVAKVSLKFLLTQIWAKDICEKRFQKFSSVSLFLKNFSHTPTSFLLLLWLLGRKRLVPRTAEELVLLISLSAEWSSSETGLDELLWVALRKAMSMEILLKACGAESPTLHLRRSCCRLTDFSCDTFVLKRDSSESRCSRGLVLHH